MRPRKRERRERGAPLNALAAMLVAALLGAGVGYAVLVSTAPEQSGERRASSPTSDVGSESDTADGEDDAADRPAARAGKSAALASAARAEHDPSPGGDVRGGAATTLGMESAGDDVELSPAMKKNRDAVELATTGDLNGAAALLRDAHALEPTNALIRTNLQAVLINRGYEDVAAEHFDAAVGHFVEALGIGDRAEIRRGLGYAYYRLGNLDLARTNLERAIAENAGDAETFVTLGRIYLERHDQAAALAMFERALAAGADAPGLQDTVARLRRDADTEKDFSALASSHFTIKFDGRENAAAGRLVLNALEEAYRKVGARFAYYPAERLEVILYPDETFRAVTSSPHWSGAVFDGRIKLPIGGLERGVERLGRTVRHEYAHAAIVTLSRGKAPVWLNEGLAQVAEETDDEGRTNRIRMAMSSSGLLSFHDLESGFTRFDRDQASLAYAQAYFAARFLVEKRGSYNVRRLLETMATADSTDAAFRQALSITYAEFEQRFAAELARQIG